MQADAAQNVDARVCSAAASPQPPEKGRGLQAHSAAGGDLAAVGKGQVSTDFATTT